MSDLITIGYFGVPGKNGGQTHLVRQETRKALCGSRFSPKSEYQWCFPHWQTGVPECERCKKIQFKLYEPVWLKEAKLKLRPKKTSLKSTEALALLARVKNYLNVGGLFNPELMDHDKVRDLIVDLGRHLEKY